ncbi:uncharacterized protein LOC114340190 [Diabrotica virgifera virgifera]|uniref:Myb/SANT-like DNA-binding domain-containing protein n=2 Tax=Diabrotica virgifera virgifera TaxID=50390 RepID=A0ABM5L203_DIAVI|nr:uncharacterized protein LOC114340190 [Diabrotica virgifera virgifera]
MDSGNLIEEILVFPLTNNSTGAIDDRGEYTNVQWSSNATKILIELYKKYRDSVGKLKMKSLKKMWQVIASKFISMGLNYSALNCENRFKVLERNYKKFVDNQNKTGRGRRVFEYFEEMNELYGGKKNVFLRVLLTATEAIVPLSMPVSEPGPSKIRPPEPAISEEPVTVDVVRATTSKKKVESRSKSGKMTALEGIRKDLREHRRRKYFLLKTRYAQRCEYEKQKINAIKRQTVVLKKIAEKLARSDSRNLRNSDE